MVTWMWVVWLLAGLVLVGLEIHTQAFYSLFLALGVFVATIVALFPTDVWVQAVVAAGVALLGTMLVRPTLVRLSAKHLGPNRHAGGIGQSRRSSGADARAGRGREPSRPRATLQ